MIDGQIRRLIDPLLNQAASRIPYSANQVTVFGFFVGVLSLPLLAAEAYSAALVAILLNRLADGLDGAIARRQGPTDLGAYLDIVLDFLFYSAVVFGFALADPGNAIFAAFLIFSFIGTGTTFLAFSIFAEKRGLRTESRGKKSIFYLGGLTEGFETIVALVLMCVVPQWFWLIAVIFGLMCWVTTLSRILVALATLSAKNAT